MTGRPPTLWPQDTVLTRRKLQQKRRNDLDQAHKSRGKALRPSQGPCVEGPTHSDVFHAEPLRPSAPTKAFLPKRTP